MNRVMLGLACAIGLSFVSSADAQVYFYGAPATVYVPGAFAQPIYAPPVYSQPVVVQPSAYYAPAYVAPSAVVPMK